MCNLVVGWLSDEGRILKTVSVVEVWWTFVSLGEKLVGATAYQVSLLKRPVLALKVAPPGRDALSLRQSQRVAGEVIYQLQWKLCPFVIVLFAVIFWLAH